uniref:Ribosome-recycling factor, mitochondrial n=1 Tax=Globodera pallida TaxID=36090 RepID=A0A183CEX7_GLOPA
MPVLVDDDEDDEDDDDGAVKKSKSGSSNNPKVLAVEAMQEMEEYLTTLNDALIKHLSLKVNLKVYEDLSVTLENGETHRLIKFARISLKTPNGPVVLNFSDNPAAIKPAKLAIQSMAENVSPQMDGIVIHVPIPKLTRERREELATHSAGLILNEYKLALNEVYKKYTKLLVQSSNNKELVVRLCNGLLAQKRKYDKMGEDKVKERSEMLLKEIDF